VEHQEYPQGGGIDNNDTGSFWTRGCVAVDGDTILVCPHNRSQDIKALPDVIKNKEFNSRSIDSSYGS